MTPDPSFGTGDEAPDVAELDLCYVTTKGRVTGDPHRIEIWFAAHGTTLYVLAGGREGADWVRNLVADARCSVEVAGRSYEATARILDENSEEDAEARRLVTGKYKARYDGDLTGWGERALPIALDVVQ